MKNFKGLWIWPAACAIAAGCEVPKSLSVLGPEAPGCTHLRHVQSEPLKALDLLFVTDSSGSLEEERERIADGIGSFIGSLPTDVHVRIAVMLAHSSKSQHSGRLWKSGAAPYVLDSREHTLEEIRKGLRTNLTETSDDWFSDGGEAGMYSLARALRSDRLAENREKGFFRKDAALAVVFVSDENDVCAAYPDGVERVPDPEGTELKALARDCVGLTPEALVDRVRATQGARPFLLGAIVYSDHATWPRVFENEYGYGYVETVQEAEGPLVDLARGDYDEGLARIGELATAPLAVRDTFPVSERVDPATIHAWVDAVATEFEHDPVLDLIKLPNPGQPGSVVDIVSCEEGAIEVPPIPVPSPEPSPSPSPEPCTGPGCEGGPIGI